jgi:hypothetical protein
MAQGYNKVEGEDIELLNSAGESDGSEGELAPPQPLLKKRATGLLVGLALVGVALIAILSNRSGSSLRNGNIDATVQLGAVATPGGKSTTSVFIIKHTFKSDDDIEPWWAFFQKIMGDKKAFKKMVGDAADAGFFNVMFLPTDKKGPFYCIWEGKDGKTKKEMETFINTNKLSPALKLKNEVTQFDLSLIGGVPPSVGDYFSQDSRRLLADRDADRELGDASPSSFYLVEHTFKPNTNLTLWWEHVHAAMSHPEAFKKWIAGTRELGFDDPGRMFPVSQKGPLYCMWEVKAGKTKADLQKFLDTNELAKGMSAGLLDNKLMEIPLELLGGHPPWKANWE